MSEWDWSEAQKIVLSRFSDKWGMLPDYQRQLTGYVFHDPETGRPLNLKLADVINEVSRLTELGKNIIVAEIQKINRLTET